MTSKERKAVAATLLQWAEWCDQSPLNTWFGWPARVPDAVWKAAYDWCEHHSECTMHTGPDVVMALCFAAASVGEEDDL